LFSLPLLKALRQHAPEAVIDSYVKPYLGELLDASGLVDTIISRRGGRAEGSLTSPSSSRTSCGVVWPS
jgi:hypothetical protein